MQELNTKGRQENVDYPTTGVANTNNETFHLKFETLRSLSGLLDALAIRVGFDPTFSAKPCCPIRYI